MGKFILNAAIATIMATGVAALFAQTNIELLTMHVFDIPVSFIIVFILSLFIAEDIRNSFKHVMRYENREDKLPIWQVGVGMIFYFMQIGIVEVFARQWMAPELDGMPMYLIISFLNAFLATVIFQEFYCDVNRENAQSFKFKKLK